MVSTYSSDVIDRESMLIDPAIARPSISWGSVLAGSAAAIATQIGLTQLCLGVGLSFYEPSQPGSSISSIATGEAWALIATAIVSLLVGGWVAGRVARHTSPTDAGIHGGLVWAVYGVAAVLFVATAAGLVTGGAVYMAGESVTALATGASAVAPAATAIVAPTWDELKTQIQEEADKVDTAKPSDERLAERSRLMELLASSFADDTSPAQKASEKNELIALVASQTGVSPAAAGRAYDQWQSAWQKATARFDAQVAEAEATAKAAAADAAEQASTTALYAFLATLLGLAAAVIGGVLGRACVCRADEIAFVGRPLTSDRSMGVPPITNDAASASRTHRIDV